MDVECPHCGERYEIDPEYIGKKLNCPDCKKEFEIKNPNLMPCPDCFSMISKRANVCPHCGARLSSANREDLAHCRETASCDISQEKEIMICSPSAMHYFWVIVFGIITIPAFLVGVFILMYVWIEIHYTSYRITTLRIVINRGWIAKIQNEIWIKDMRAANLIQGIWQRCVGVGNISIGTAATSGTEICMIGIENPQHIVDEINSLRH